ncbi:MAG TPA: helical backbone metal receptor [Thermoanaerobaculia bacterium]|nr:helical backbone metal receptor [Thermoanaerobaculia bacterium]
MIADVRGRELRFDHTPQRVVSLVPSLTETLFDLGAGETVAGATDFCIHPPQMPCVRVGGTKNPDVERIRSLAPDIVYMNLEENLRRHGEQIESFAPVFVTEPKSVDDVRNLIATLATIHGKEERGRELVAQLDGERDAMPPRSFTFACAIWKKPWMWCGGDTYVSSLVEAAGGVNVLRHQQRYPEMSLDCMASLQPEIVFLPDEPYAFDQDDAREVTQATGARVHGPFPGHLFTWHGTRTILGLRFLRDALERDRPSG